MNKICIICGKEFSSNVYNKKTCSDECRRQHEKKYNEEYNKNYYNSENGKINIIKAVTKYQKLHPEKVKEINKNRWKRYLISSLSKEEMEKFQELAKQQQFMEECTIKEIGTCPVCNLEKSLLEHHISYNPEKTIYMCPKCHGILHSRFLKGKRCRKYKIVV